MGILSPTLGYEECFFQVVVSLSSSFSGLLLIFLIGFVFATGRAKHLPYVFWLWCHRGNSSVYPEIMHRVTKRASFCTSHL